jgi:CubicO group peptidase (beta-lactamase class C family)
MMRAYWFAMIGLLVVRASPPPALDGLWASENTFGPVAHGDLVVDGRRPLWVATIAGFEVPVRHGGDSVTLSLPNDQGWFRGLRHVGDAEIRGWWIQPPRTGGAQALATPLTLAAVTRGVWRGHVDPLPDTRFLYLWIQRGSDGSLSAMFRSLESDMFAHRAFRVEQRGDRVRFIGRTDSTDQLSARLDSTTSRLTVRIPIVNFGRLRYVGDFAFTRRDTNDAIGFMPRTPPASRYEYHVPIPDKDGWPVDSLAGVDIDQMIVSRLVAAILDTRPADESTPNIQALLIARHGKLVLEEYFNGFDRERPHDLRSAGKSFTSALAGIAIDRGARFGLASRVWQFFPDAPRDARKDSMTVKDLLTMRSGLSCDDGDDASPGNETRMFAQDTQPDWYRFTMGLPMARSPGGIQSIYCSAGIHLVTGVIGKSTGQPGIDAFERDLARPLQFHHYYLNLTPAGDYYGAGGLYVRPRDALKLGQVYLDRGVWNGRRIVSAAWVDRSTRRLAGFNAMHGYGLAWHVFELPLAGRVYREYEAEGNGGQVIAVVPGLDLAIMFTTGNYGYDMTVPQRGILGGVAEAIRAGIRR